VAESRLGSSSPVQGHALFRLEFQTLWETSRVRPGEAGIITDYLGSKPGISDAKSALDACRLKMAESLDQNAVTSWFWSVYPFALGGYASAKTGQYTTLLELAAEPALHGRLQFAGEHTSTDFLGFMNGGVQSGNRAAATLIKVLLCTANARPSPQVARACFAMALLPVVE